MKLRVYGYKNCDTCRRALSFLAARGVAFAEIQIREQPPTRAELTRMLRRYDGDLRKLFNTGGQDYRSLGLKERLPGMSEAEALDLLAANGNLVKRPFALTQNGGAIGFKEAEWARLISG